MKKNVVIWILVVLLVGNEIEKNFYKSLSRGLIDIIEKPKRSASKKKYDFRKEFVFSEIDNAIEARNYIFGLVKSRGYATVGDLYNLVGIEATPMDYRWGWMNAEAGDFVISATDDGNDYCLEFKDPQFFG
jgi:hypothetical protein